MGGSPLRIFGFSREVLNLVKPEMDHFAAKMFALRVCNHRNGAGPQYPVNRIEIPDCLGLQEKGRTQKTTS